MGKDFGYAYARAAIDTAQTHSAISIVAFPSKARLARIRIRMSDSDGAKV
jgi:hypothetical protein